MRDMKTVLYIDDSADDLFLFSKACEMAGVSFRLKLVHGSAAAWAYLNSCVPIGDGDAQPLPDFVLLDIKMPEADGFEVLKWIRSTPRITDALVALYSSSTVDRDVLRGYLTGTTYYIPKSQGM